MHHKVNFIIATSHNVLTRRNQHLFSLSADVSCGHYKFEVDKDKVDREHIVRAELHIYQALSPVASAAHYHVNIYYLLRAQDLESPLQIAFNNVSSTPGWKIFDITKIAQSWKKQGWVNYGLQVKLTSEDGKTLPCDGVFADVEVTEPLLVVYTHDHGSKFFEGLLKQEEKAIQHVTQQHRRKRSTTIKVTNVGCHRKELKIKRAHLSSDKIHLQFPREFDAGACEGHCKKFELNRQMSYSSVVSLHYMHTIGLQKAPSRCCVPTEFDAVKLMLFYDTTTKQNIFKKNVKVIAKKCGCL